MLVTICIPTLNEEEGIGPTLAEVNQEAFKAMGCDVELLVIDGESKDATREEAEKQGARVVVEPRRGYGRAYKRGFGEAQGDIIVTGDADGTYPFDKCHEYVQDLLDNNDDFLTCNRYADLKPGAMSGKHKLGNWVLSFNTRMLFRIHLRDSQTGMWIIRRSILEKIPYAELSEGMAFSQEIKIEALKRRDVDAREIPAELRPRIGEPVIESWRDGFGNLAALWKMRFSRRWS